MLQHPRLEALSKAARRLLTEKPPTSRPGIGAFGMGHAGLVQQLHRTAHLSKVVSQKTKLAHVGRAFAPPIQPDPHVNGSRKGVGGYHGGRA